MINTFEKMLTGGHPNSLGKTEEVVDVILADRTKLKDLYDCYESKDEVVRLRVSSAFKRISKTQPTWMTPYIDRFIDEVATLNQPSAQWSFAQIMLWIDEQLTEDQRNKVITAPKHNLEFSDDWIVLNMTMETLTEHAKQDSNLKKWLKPHLTELSRDKRKSVAKRANKFVKELA